MESHQEINNPSGLIVLLLVVALVSMGIIFISQQSNRSALIFPSSANTYVPIIPNTDGVISTETN